MSSSQPKLSRINRLSPRGPEPALRGTRRAHALTTSQKLSPRIPRKRASSHNPRDVSPIPSLRYETFDKLALHIELHGLEQQGIFRIAGDSIQTEELFNNLVGNPYNLELDGYKINVVADTLKLYLRKQEESLLPTEVYDHFNSVLKLVCGFGTDQSDDSDDKTEILIQLCQLLPIDHKPILRRLLQLLWDVHIRSEKNKMDADNLRDLSMIFGPCIVQNMETITDMSIIYAKSQEGVEMCKLLILNSKKLMNVLSSGKAYSLLGRLPRILPQVIDSLSAAGTPRKFNRGDSLVPKSSESLFLYVARSSSRNANSNKIIQWHNMALLDISSSICCYTCVSDVRVYEISRKIVECFFVSDPKFQKNLYWQLGRLLSTLIRRSQIRGKQVIQSEAANLLLERDVTLNVKTEELNETITLYFNEQDKINEVISTCVEEFGLKGSQRGYYRLSSSFPSEKLKKVSTEKTLLSALYTFIDEDERVQTLLSADTKSREVTLYLVNCKNDNRRLSVGSLRKQKRSRSVETKFDIQELDGLMQSTCRMKNKRITLKIFPRAIIYSVSTAYGKDKKHHINLADLQITNLPENRLMVFFANEKKKLRPFLFSDLEELLGTLRMISVLRSLITPNSTSFESVARGEVLRVSDVESVNEFPVSTSNIILLSDKMDGSYVAEYGGCSGLISTEDVKVIEEPVGNQALVHQKLFTLRALNHLPTQQEWSLLINSGTQLTFSKGDIILHQGCRKQQLYFMQSGACQLTKKVANLETKKMDLCLLREMECGEIFGTESFIMGGESLYNATATVEQTHVVVLDPQKVSGLFTENSVLCGRFMKYFCCSLYEMLNIVTLSSEAVRFSVSK